MTEQIKTTLQKGLPNATIYVKTSDGTHFDAIVVSPDFQGISLIKQHQMVMGLLKEEFEGTLHALSLKTFTPEKWEKEVLDGSITRG